MKKIFYIIALTLSAAAFASCEKTPFDPAQNGNNPGKDPGTTATPDSPLVDSKGYATMEHGGFTYKMKATEVTTTAGKKAIAHLNDDIDVINSLIPEAALKIMKEHVIWLERNLTDGAAWYHVSKEWLASEGYMTEKWRCVELCNFVNYVNWSNQNQPYMVLHELCHLYHDLGLTGGYNNKDVLDAYNHAKSSGMYKGTWYRYNTKDPKSAWVKTDAAYCLNTVAEYFSEMCEAYWGENDYYPFNREQLQEYDPQAFAVMEKVWGSL